MAEEDFAAMGSPEAFERRMRRLFYEPRWTGGLAVSTAIFVGAGWHVVVRERGLRELLLSAIVLWLTLVGSVLAHELGHAVVAWAVNLLGRRGLSYLCISVAIAGDHRSPRRLADMSSRAKLTKLRRISEKLQCAGGQATSGYSARKQGPPSARSRP